MFVLFYPARQPRDRDWGRGAEIVMATIFGFICLIQQFQAPIPNSGSNPPALPEQKQLAGNYLTRVCDNDLFEDWQSVVVWD